MATYPPVTATELEAALARIATRHDDDPRWSEAGSEPRDLLAYLRRRHAGTARDLAARDVWDELVVSAWLHWEERRRERELLHRALSYGLSLAELGRFLGIGTRQGTRDYLDRLAALLEETALLTRPRSPAALRLSDPAVPYPPESTRARLSEDRRAYGLSVSHIGLSRAARGADAHSRRRARARPSQTEWLDRHRARVFAVILELLTQLERAGITTEESDAGAAADLGDYLTWLAEDLENSGQEISRETISTLGLALGELRHYDTIRELARNHGLPRAIGAADRLRSDYADRL